ncbi:MAG: hypothetical protein ACSLFO_00475 [Acidimicrobiales bacterium]
MSGIVIDVDRHDDHLLVRWSDVRSTGSCRFDRIPGTAPEWLGSADELLEGADRRQETRILDAIGVWATGEAIEIGIWHDDAGVELLT